MQSSIVAIWLANLPYRQSTDNAVIASTQWSRTERIVLFDVGIAVKITNGLVWSVLLSTTIFVKTVVKIVDLLNEHDVKKYNSQMFRCNLWIAALYLSYMKALKKRIQLPYGDIPDVWTIFTKKRKTKPLVKIRCCLSISSDSKN